MIQSLEKQRVSKKQRVVMMFWYGEISYEFYRRVVKTIFYERAQSVNKIFVIYCFHHEKMRFVSLQNQDVMLCLLSWR